MTLETVFDHSFWTAAEDKYCRISYVAANGTEQCSFEFILMVGEVRLDSAGRISTSSVAWYSLFM